MILYFMTMILVFTCSECFNQPAQLTQGELNMHEVLVKNVLVTRVRVDGVDRLDLLDI
jgi:hypothetical protein